MKTMNDYFENSSLEAVEQQSYTQESNSDEDPFADVDQHKEPPKYYRLNDKVFAEPLTAMSGTNLPIEDSNIELPTEITFVGSIGIQRRPGKRKKYFIDTDDLTNLTCPQAPCKKRFSSTTLLKAHIRKIHCSDRNGYVCELCGAGFSARYLLNRHARVHSGGRVKCPVCEKMLSVRTNLSTHLRSHSADRPHRCTCGKGFVRRSALKRHEKFVHRNG